MKKILANVLKAIVPTRQEEEQVFSKINAFLAKLGSSLGDAAPILGGSMAKGTWIKGVHDADIFVKFPYKKYSGKTSELSDILEKKIRRLKLTRLHGSRDYFQIRQESITYEIIPILDIAKADHALNITDISPLHAKWVKKNLKDPSQVRLAKAFCKAQGVYGAESYIMGFSGYVVEILTVYYGSFERFVRQASKWGSRTIIDPMKYHKNVMFEVNQSKLVSPLVLIDPVQKGRNTAAGLSKENYDRFVRACQAYLDQPSEDFFIAKKVSKSDLSQKAKDKALIFVEVKAVSGKEDVVGGKLKKAFDFFSRELVRHDFLVADKGWEFDIPTKAIFWYFVSPKELPKKREWPGPPLKSSQNVDAFKKKYSNTFTKGNRIFATITRKYTKPSDLIKSLGKDPYLKDKLKSYELK
ncbi:MAG: CCA tRNA nucleotidyltransferase [Candidatus Woesearchaeota archaeon]